MSATSPPSRGTGAFERARRRAVRVHPAFWYGLAAFLPLMLVVAFRGDTTDTAAYVEAFEGTRSFPWNPITYYSQWGMEWAFGMASYFLNVLQFDVRTLFFLVSFGTFYFLARAADRMGTSLVAMAPYYLGTYFLVQQFLQIRQGLAIAFAFSMLPLIIGRRLSSSGLRATGSVLVGATMHSASVIPTIVGSLLDRSVPPPTRRRIVTWCVIIMVITFGVARVIMSVDVFSSLGRLAEYASSAEYGSERDILAPANVRAVLMLLLFWFASPARLLESRIYVVMLGMYACHVGIRFGFYDFIILSGRMSTTLGFAEVFMLPLLVRHRVRNPWLRLTIGVLYLALHAGATLQTQLPTLIDDYFAPLQYHHSTD